MDDVILTRRLEAIEHQIRVISERLGVPCPPFAGDGLADQTQPPGSTHGLPDEVVELARAGHATEAIARLRHLTGASLLEAKRAVDAL